MQENVNIDPDPVIVGDDRVEVTFELAAPEETAVSGLLRRPDGTVAGLEFNRQPSPCNWGTRHFLGPDGPFGVWKIEVTTEEGPVTQEFHVEKRGVRPESRFPEFDVQPRVVEEDDDGQVTVTGLLEIAEHPERAERWEPFPGQTVQIQFREEDSCAWRHVTDVLTGDRGEFAVRATAEGSGEWRAAYASSDRASGSKSRSVRTCKVRSTKIEPYSITRDGEVLKHTGRLIAIRRSDDTKDNHPQNRAIKAYLNGKDANRGDMNADQKGNFFFTTNVKAGKWTVKFAGDPCYKKSQKSRRWPT